VQLGGSPSHRVRFTHAAPSLLIPSHLGIRTSNFQKAKPTLNCNGKDGLFHPLTPACALRQDLSAGTWPSPAPAHWLALCAQASSLVGAVACPRGREGLALLQKPPPSVSKERGLLFYVPECLVSGRQEKDSTRQKSSFRHGSTGTSTQRLALTSNPHDGFRIMKTWYLGTPSERNYTIFFFHAGS
jgi:hypothetical protein